MGKGDMLSRLFPGYQERLWQHVPPNLKNRYLTYKNQQFEANLYHIGVKLNSRVKWYHQHVLDRIQPSSVGVFPAVDYKRQKARGTLVVGTNSYIPDTYTQQRVQRHHAPYSEEEVRERSAYRYQSLKFYLLIALAASAYHGYNQKRPVAWCSGIEAPKPPTYPFWFKHIFNSFDIPSVRRGYEVYRKVCAVCHSLQYIHFRHLSNEVLPEKRMKQIAATYDIETGPNEEGEMFTRPGTLRDPLPKPYPNDEAARYANGGALPPDLSVIVAARENGPDYIYSLLTGYCDPPVGIEMPQGTYFNTYFHGGAIAMPPPLMDELIEYEDGTPCNVSQMAKDVTEFLTWTTEPYHDDRKIMGIKAVSALFVSFVALSIWTRVFGSIMSTMRIDFGKVKHM